jgi:hypothetical protein
MSLASRNFKKHGNESFPVSFDDGSEHLCCAIKNDRKVKVGFFKKYIWKDIQWKQDTAALADQYDYLAINEVRIIKSGWFALATVDLYLEDSSIVRGKTDKGFAEFLVSINHLIENE